MEVNLQLLDTVLEKLPDNAAISSTCPPNIESNLSDLSSDFMTPRQKKKKESSDLMETASVMFSNPKQNEEIQKMKVESIRREDERKEKDRARKECEAKLKEHTELLEKIERLHNKVMTFPADGNEDCKQMLNATLSGCLKRAQALGEEIGLIE